MRALPSLSDWLRARSARERVFLATGAAALAVTTTLSLGVFPLADRWAAREATYEAARERWSRLRGIMESETRLRRAVEERRGATRDVADRQLGGASPALAASSLQALLQQYAVESLVQLNRIDVAGQPKPAGPGLVAVPVMVQGQGDIQGFTDFLARLQNGRKLLVIDEMSVGLRSSWTAGEQPLVWTVRAYGVYPSAAGGKT